MLPVTPNELDRRMRFDNPWWEAEATAVNADAELPKRRFFTHFHDLVRQREVNRAVVLMGPRRVGKTVMLSQSIDALIADGMPATDLVYMSLDTPLYSGWSLEALLQRFHALQGHHRHSHLTVCFDEIQYLQNWEIHLKSLVDSYPSHRFVASGSAAAALRLKSRESGAGRFTEFLLPPLTFVEYLEFIGEHSLLATKLDWPIRGKSWQGHELDTLNRHFIDYINIGGYPEAVLSEHIRKDRARYIKSDIIEKVLLRDLPSLYGVNDIPALNRLFNVLAYNSGQEISLEQLSKQSGTPKNTLKRYLEYMEAAFLIKTLHRIDQNAKRFKRATQFKIYLTNPSLRAALFGPIDANDAAMGPMVETALLGQLLLDGSVDHTYYARWPKGEIDFVQIAANNLTPNLAIEVKWSDRPKTDQRLTKHLCKFMDTHTDLKQVYITSIGASGTINTASGDIQLIPAADLALALGQIGLIAKTAGLLEKVHLMMPKPD